LLIACVNAVVNDANVRGVSLVFISDIALHEYYSFPANAIARSAIRNEEMCSSVLISPPIRPNNLR
jgi:hypothetical protein